jgi:adenylate kinase family enzyme
MIVCVGTPQIFVLMGAIHKYIQNQVDHDSNEYIEKHSIRPIFESLLVAVTYNKPDEPLGYMQKCLDQIKSTPRAPIWNQFIPTSLPVFKESPKVSAANDFIPSLQMKPTLVVPPIPKKGKDNIVFVLGGPGSGKGTQCAKLAMEYNLVHLSTGDLLREQVDKRTEIGLTAAELMSQGQMVPSNVILDLLNQKIDQYLPCNGFLVDGFPRAIDQAHEFEKRIGPCRAVLAYKCNLDVLKERLLERGKSSGRVDDNITTIVKRFETFEKQSLPVINYYLEQGKCLLIASDRSVDNVYQDSKRVFATRDANIVFVLGGPGSGKGTQCSEIVNTLGYVHLSTGDLLREQVKLGTSLGIQLDSDMKEGKMVSDVSFCNAGDYHGATTDSNDEAQQCQRIFSRWLS